jgi:hypothetical protein
VTQVVCPLYSLHHVKLLALPMMLLSLLEESAMKVVLIVIGVLASVYCMFGILQFIRIFTASDPGSVGGGTNIAAGILPVCLGGVLALICFKKAFKKTV